MGIFGDFAQKYWEYGLSVVPCEGQATISTWKHLQTQKQTEAELEKLINDFPDCNIAMPMGRGSGIVAFDLDVDSLEVRVNLEKIIPPTPSMKFGAKGMTYFYKWNESVDKIKRGKHKSGKQLYDFLTTKSYTVVPPSIHPKTNRPYTWIGKPLFECIDDLPYIYSKDLDAADKYLKSLKFDDNVIDGKIEKREGRNTSLVSFVAAWSDKIQSTDILVQKAIEFDLLNHPENPLFLDPEENNGVNPKVNAFRFVSSVINSINTFKEERGELLSLKPDENFYENQSTGFFYLGADASGRPTEKPDYRGLAKYLKNELHFVHDDGADYLYGESKYDMVTDSYLRNKIVDLTLDKGQPGHVSNFLKATQDRCYRQVSEIDYSKEGLINLDNGILNINNRELIPHSPEYFFRYKIPHKFNPDAKCEKWLQTLDYIFEGNQELCDVLAEIFGYAIEGGYPWLHKAFCFYGEGRNGKSTVLDVLMQMLHKSNFSIISLKNLGKPFSALSMDGKLANIVEESPIGVIESEAFKNCVSGGYITASKKGKDEFDMAVRCRFIFATNKLITLGDNSTGATERLVFIPFNRYIAPNERVPEFSKGLYSEIPGVINWALDGLKRLKERKRLPDMKSVDDIKEDYKMESDSQYFWVKNYLEYTGSNQFISTDALFNSYVEDTKNKFKSHAGYPGFSRRLPKLLTETKIVPDDFIVAMLKDRKQHEHGYIGFKIKPKPIIRLNT